MLKLINPGIVADHVRVVCPECFDVLYECMCGGDERTTGWRLCDICMKRTDEHKTLLDAIPENKLLNARLVFSKILPLIDFPKEFIPARLHPGYDQWKGKILASILSSGTDEEKLENPARLD